MPRKRRYTAASLDLRMDELRNATAAEIDPALYAAGEDILAAAQANAPVRTGALRDSGYVATPKKSSYMARKGLHRPEIKADAETAVITFAAFYGYFVEVGTARRPARPFLRPAFEARKSAAAELVAQRIRKALE